MRIKMQLAGRTQDPGLQIPKQALMCAHDHICKLWVWYGRPSKFCLL